MGKYVVKRVLLALLTVLIICAITFFTMHAVPGGPFNREKALSEATIAALNARYGLDRPVGEQFLRYMQGVLRGDFGVSLKNGREITAIIKESFPISARLGLSAMVVAIDATGRGQRLGLQKIVDDRAVGRSIEPPRLVLDQPIHLQCRHKRGKLPALEIVGNAGERLHAPVLYPSEQLFVVNGTEHLPVRILDIPLHFPSSALRFAAAASVAATTAPPPA